MRLYRIFLPPKAPTGLWPSTGTDLRAPLGTLRPPPEGCTTRTSGLSESLSNAANPQHFFALRRSILRRPIWVLRQKQKYPRAFADFCATEQQCCDIVDVDVPIRIPGILCLYWLPQACMGCRKDRSALCSQLLHPSVHTWVRTYSPCCRHFTAGV